MRSQADRDEVTLDIASALAFGVAMGALAAFLTWMFDAMLPGPVDWDWVVGFALATAAICTLGRVSSASQRRQRSL